LSKAGHHYLLSTTKLKSTFLLILGGGVSSGFEQPSPGAPHLGLAKSIHNKCCETKFIPIKNSHTTTSHPDEQPYEHDLGFLPLVVTFITLGLYLLKRLSLAYQGRNAAPKHFTCLQAYFL